MKLSEKQQLFAKNIGLFLIWIFEQPGYSVTLGEALRTEDQQLLYFEGKTLTKTGTAVHLVSASRKSKTMKSKHMKKMAIDLNLFIDGTYQTGKEAYKPLADYWKCLNPKNVAGYDWGWDASHFEMES